jgi:hypothetical protein
VFQRSPHLFSLGREIRERGERGNDFLFPTEITDCSLNGRFDDRRIRVEAAGGPDDVVY